MRNVRACLGFVLLTSACTISHQQAADPPPVPYRLLGLSLNTGSCWPGPSCDIYGLRLGIAESRHRDVFGIDLPGVMGRRDRSGGGIAAALLLNDTDASFYGVQITAGLNTGPYSDRAGHRAWGIQIAPGNFADAAGVQIGLVNGLAPIHDAPHSGIAGIQLGLWNAGGNVYGIQAGGLTSFASDVWGIQVAPIAGAQQVRGLQIGLYTMNFDGGLQIGLINYNAKSILPWCPGLNLGW